MAFRPDRKFIIHMMQRNRRRRDATLNPPDGVLGWVTPPPATGATNVDYSVSWQNGAEPYNVQISKDGGVVKEQHSSASSFTLNVDTAGRYEWLLISGDGQRLVGTTIIS